MNVRSRRIFKCVATVLCCGLAGCPDKEPAAKEPKKTIKLRVVMVLDDTALVEQPDPDARTGGTKLSSAQVVALVEELMDFGEKAAPGIEFSWDTTADFQTLRSTCMNIGNTPTGCVGGCGVCPRGTLNSLWFAANIVGKQVPTNDTLVQDPYDNDDCTLNIYFVGDILDKDGNDLAGYAVRGPAGSTGLDYVLVNDLAKAVPLAPAKFSELSKRRTLAHEAACHWLPNGDNHVEKATSGIFPCPDNLCVSGESFAACKGVPIPVAYSTHERPGKVLVEVQNDTKNRRQNCTP